MMFEFGVEKYCIVAPIVVTWPAAATSAVLFASPSM